MSDQRFHTFSNGTEGRMWLERNCEGCRKYRPNAVKRQNACRLEWDVHWESWSTDDTSVSADIALRAGFAVEGDRGTLVAIPPGHIAVCTERRGKDDPPDPRFPRRPRPPKGQLDLLDPRNQEPARDPAAAGSGGTR